MKQRLRKSNRETPIVIQIESLIAPEPVDAFANVSGVDLLMFVPADFCVSAGTPDRFDHPILVRARNRLTKTGRASSIHCGPGSPNQEMGRKQQKKGTRIDCHGFDTLLMNRSFEEIQSQYVRLGFAFGNCIGAVAEELEHCK